MGIHRGIFLESHVEFSVVLDWIKFVTLTCSKTLYTLKLNQSDRRPTSRKREKVRSRKVFFGMR